jgi:trehalose/maltose hydrolase-like predicted phosphorylase
VATLRVTDDVEFLATTGLVLIEIARFFSSLAVFNPDRGALRSAV